MDGRPFFLDLMIPSTPQKIIKTLTPYLTEERIKRIDSVLSNRIHSVQVAVESPYDVHNGLAIVRTAEAMGVSRVHFIQAEMRKGQGKATTRSALKWTHLMRHDTLPNFLGKKGKFLLAGASLDAATPLDDLPLEQPICFLFGNEQRGLTDDAKEACDFLYHVPMHGMVESYNLSVSAAITLHDYLKRKRSSMDRSGDLTEEEYLEEKAHFYVRSLGAQTAHSILKRSQL